MDDKPASYDLASFSISSVVWAQFMGWISRACLVVQIYLFCDWEGVLILLWLMHSVVSQRMKPMAKFTQWVFLPILVLVFLFTYAINIDGLVSPSFVLKSQNGFYGIFYFDVPILEAFFM